MTSLQNENPTVYDVKYDQGESHVNFFYDDEDEREFLTSSEIFGTKYRI
jgi:hypothetical protein